MHYWENNSLGYNTGLAGQLEHKRICSTTRIIGVPVSSKKGLHIHENCLNRGKNRDILILDVIA